MWMQDILDELPIGIALLDSDGCILYLNVALQSLLDLARLNESPLQGRHLPDLSPFTGSEQFQEEYGRLETRERMNYRWSLNQPDGNGSETERIFRVQGFPLATSDNGGADSMLLVEDITEGYRLKMQLGRAQRMESVGSLASAVAHDFNNILTVILSSVHLLKNDISEDSKLCGPLDVIEGTALSAGDLAEQLLTLARPRHAEKRILDLNTVISEAKPLLKRVLREGVRLTIDLEKDLWCIRSDPSQILHTLVNLCINAQEAMDDRGEITISTRNVDRSGGTVAEGGLEPGHYVLLSVADEGCGIPDEVVDRVFDPFFTTKKGGTGLGLSTAYTFANEQGGTVTLYSEVDRGTKINVYLRAEPVRAVPAEISSGREDKSDLTGTETILLVDDETLLLDLGREILSLQGYNVVTASTGEEAVDVFLSSNGRIPLAILDMAMPGMSGIETLRAIREQDPEVRAIISSGFHASEKMKKVLESEVDAFINKPYEIDHLTSEVRRVLDA